MYEERSTSYFVFRTLKLGGTVPHNQDRKFLPTKSTRAVERAKSMFGTHARKAQLEEPVRAALSSQSLRAQTTPFPPPANRTTHRHARALTPSPTVPFRQVGESRRVKGRRTSNMNIGNLLGAMGKVPSKNKEGPPKTPELLCLWQKKSDDDDKPKRGGARDEPTEVMCVRFSPDSSILAAGCGDGIVRLYKPSDGSFYGVLGGGKMKDEDRLPNMCLRWRPPQGTARDKDKKGQDRQVLMVGNADGALRAASPPPPPPPPPLRRLRPREQRLGAAQAARVRRRCRGRARWARCSPRRAARPAPARTPCGSCGSGTTRPRQQEPWRCRASRSASRTRKRQGHRHPRRQSRSAPAETRSARSRARPQAAERRASGPQRR